jgi:undecaprenyl-diphosphatase
MNQIIFFSLYSLAHQSKFLDWLIVFSAETFGYIMVFLIAFYIFFYEGEIFNHRVTFLRLKNKIKEMFVIFSAPLAAWIIATVVKSFIFAPRPFMFFENVKPLFVHGGFDSFPSGHAMFFGALATSLYFKNKRLGLIYIIVALIVGLARVTSGIHFPIDIFFGYIFGFIIALIFKVIFKKIK